MYRQQSSSDRHLHPVIINTGSDHVPLLTCPPEVHKPVTHTLSAQFPPANQHQLNQHRHWVKKNHLSLCACLVVGSFGARVLYITTFPSSFIREDHGRRPFTVRRNTLAWQVVVVELRNWIPCFPQSWSNSRTPPRHNTRPITVN